MQSQAWLSIDSKLWSVRAYNGGLASITQRSSGVTRYVSRHSIPDADTLAASTEARFNKLMREAFHAAAQQGG
jgi:hypothetical protein